MAARAHVARDYSFGDVPRRDVYFRREDPVVLPRSRGFSIDFRLIGAALLASALVTAATYAVFATAPPMLAETPTLPLVRDWTPSPESAHASALKALAGPALATRSLSEPRTPADSEPIIDAGASQPVPYPAVPQSPPASEPATDSPKAQDLVPELPKPEVYPNPTTTPPEGVAPREVSPEVPSPALDPENPYR